MHSLSSGLKGKKKILSELQRTICICKSKYYIIVFVLFFNFNLVIMA